MKVRKEMLFSWLKDTSSEDARAHGFTLIECVVILVFAAFVMVVSMSVLVAAPRSIAQSVSAEADALAVNACIERLDAIAQANRATGNVRAAVILGGKDPTIAGEGVEVTFKWLPITIDVYEEDAPSSDMTTRKVLLATVKKGDMEVHRAWSE